MNGPPKTDEEARLEAVAAYKTVLREVLDGRPSGTRQRLAAALETNRSFITQIANPAYPVPVPAQHLPLIFRVCRFSSVERDRFLEAYRSAHPGRPVAITERSPRRIVQLPVPDLGSDVRNRALDRLLRTFVAALSDIMAENHQGEGAAPQVARAQSPGRRKTQP